MYDRVLHFSFLSASRGPIPPRRPVLDHRVVVFLEGKASVSSSGAGSELRLRVRREPPIRVG